MFLSFIQMFFAGKMAGITTEISPFFLTSNNFVSFFLNSQSNLLTCTILLIYTLILCSNNRLYYRLYTTVYILNKKQNGRRPLRIPVLCQLYIRLLALYSLEFSLLMFLYEIYHDFNFISCFVTAFI